MDIMQMKSENGCGHQKAMNNKIEGPESSSSTTTTNGTKKRAAEQSIKSKVNLFQTIRTEDFQFFSFIQLRLENVAKGAQQINKNLSQKMPSQFLMNLRKIWCTS